MAKLVDENVFPEFFGNIGLLVGNFANFATHLREKHEGFKVYKLKKNRKLVKVQFK
jgi:hypothetical protein